MEEKSTKETSSNYLSPNSINNDAAASSTSLTTSVSSNNNILTVEEATKKAKNASAFYLFFKQLWVMIKRNATFQVSKKYFNSCNIS